MSVEQAIHELQEQLQRVSASHQAMHQELTTLPRYGRYEVARPVGGAKEFDCKSGSGSKNGPELENLVVSGERRRRRGARRA